MNPSGVTLREITPDNQAAVEALEVTETQSNYVSGVTQSLADALEEPDARPWYRAIYAGDRPVGFIMLSDGITVVNPRYLGPYYLWRLLIDQHEQRNGYGSAALSLAIDYLRTRPGAEVLLTSVQPGPESPMTFYLKQGFKKTGQVHEGEDVLELPLG